MPTSFDFPETPVPERPKSSPVERFCELVTGLKLEDPAIKQRLTEDRKIIREKYHLLPVEQIREMPLKEFEEWVEKRMKKAGYKLRPGLEVQSYFDETDAYAVTVPDERVVYQSLRGEEGRRINALEHELIHTLQPEGMPIEAREYETALGTANPEALERIVNAGSAGLIFLFMANNAREFYRNRGEIVPWDKK